jgi:hypothetical protein
VSGATKPSGAGDSLAAASPALVALDEVLHAALALGLAPLSWADTEAVDAGTARVVHDGFSIVFDPHGTLAGLAEVVELVKPAGLAADVRDNT